MSTLPSNALATRKEVKDYLNITGADNNLDNLINDLIGRVSSAFEGYCGRAFVEATYTEYYDGNGQSKLFLDNYLNILFSSSENSIIDNSSFI